MEFLETSASLYWLKISTVHPEQLFWDSGVILPRPMRDSGTFYFQVAEITENCYICVDSEHSKGSNVYAFTFFFSTFCSERLMCLYLYYKYAASLTVPPDKAHCICISHMEVSRAYSIVLYPSSWKKKIVYSVFWCSAYQS